MELPLAPRPFPDEALSSWIARIAARYDLSGNQLISFLKADLGEGDLRLGSAGYRNSLTDQEIIILARATRMLPTKVRALQFSNYYPRIPRSWLVERQAIDRFEGRSIATGEVIWEYCSSCLEEDAMEGRDAYIRQHWALGCFGFCHRHKKAIKRGCPSCGDTVSLSFTNIQGAWELVCQKCSFVQRAALASKGPSTGRDDWARGKYIKRANYLVIDFERCLFRALMGKTPSPRWMGNASATEFIRATESLIELLISDLAPHRR